MRKLPKSSFSSQFYSFHQALDLLQDKLNRRLFKRVLNLLLLVSGQLQGYYDVEEDNRRAVAKQMLCKPSNLSGWGALSLCC